MKGGYLVVELGSVVMMMRKRRVLKKRRRVKRVVFEF
jgi:hypothetical protein